MKDFTGKIAVVTGAAHGIGLALSEKFTELGMKVVMADVREDALADAAKRLSALAVPTDVTKAEDVQALAQRTLDEFGAVHVVCNNAGVFVGGTAWETPLEDYEWIFAVNVRGVIHGVRTFVPILLAQDEESHVVNTASMAGTISTPFSAAYNMSKHAVLTLSETLYHELAMSGGKVHVHALCPELIATNIDKSEETRPAALRRDAPPSAARDLTRKAIEEGMTTGTPPSVMAERVVAGIRENRFYLLAEDVWRDACHSRLEDVRLAQNPRFVPPVSEP